MRHNWLLSIPTRLREARLAADHVRTLKDMAAHSLEMEKWYTDHAIKDEREHQVLRDAGIYHVDLSSSYRQSAATCARAARTLAWAIGELTK